MCCQAYGSQGRFWGEGKQESDEQVRISKTQIPKGKVKSKWDIGESGLVVRKQENLSNYSSKITHIVNDQDPHQGHLNPEDYGF